MILMVSLSINRKAFVNPRGYLDTSRQAVHHRNMYRVGVKKRFSAAHSLREYGGNCENLHGHNWVVEVVYNSDSVDKIGMVVDFRALKEALDKILDGLDHCFLNDLDAFKEINPSSENISKYIYDKMRTGLGADINGAISSVRVWESEDSWAEYSG